MEQLEFRLSEKKQSVISRIFQISAIKKLEQDLQRKLETQEQFEQEYTAISAQFQELEQNRGDSRELDESKALLGKFYQDQEAAWNDHEQQERARDITNVAKKHEALLIHAIHPSFTPEENSLLHQGTSWQTKLDILLALEPTISTSTIRKGDRPDNMWSGMGVILARGSIVDAAPTDAGTRATRINARGRSGSFAGEPKAIEGKIDHAISARSPDNYNELVVEKPKIAGLFLSVDDIPEHKRLSIDRVGAEEMVTKARELGVPLYAISQGEAFETSWDETQQKLILGRQRSSEDIMQPIEIPEEKRHSLEENLFKEAPFRVHNIEVEYFDSISWGRSFFVELSYGETAGEAPEAEGTFALPAKYSGAGIDKDTPLRKIAEFSKFGGQIIYVEQHGKLLKIARDKIRDDSHGKMARKEDYGRGWINIGYNTHDLEREIGSHQDYIEAMRTSMQGLIAKRDQSPKDERYEENMKVYTEWLNKLATHLHGYAQQARQMGQEDKAVDAENLGNSVFPSGDIATYSAKRINPDGTFKVYREDLE